MTINGISRADTQMGQRGMNQAADSYSRNIQNQIASAQKQLQDISSNEDMTMEEKMKKRQEIQKQISDLNMQLRQHQMEQRKEKQQAKKSSMNDVSGGTGNKKAGGRSGGFSKAGMTAIISADNSIKQAQIQGSVAVQMEGRAGVLQSEIKLGQATGSDTRKKEEELAETEDAKKDKNVKNDKQAKYVNSKHTDGNVSGTAVQGGSVNTQPDVSVSNSAAAAGTKPQRPMDYVPVDIRL